MRQKYTFHHDHYYNTLREQVGQGIPVFHGLRQRGGGLGSVLGGFAKYALPLLVKYIMPHAKEAVLKSVGEIAGGSHSVKSSLKRNGIGFLKNVGEGLLDSLTTSSKQIGKGIRKRTYTQANLSKKTKKTTAKKKKTAKKITKKVTPKKKKKTTTKRSRFDIFE